ncbi:MAG: winged helix-turn-helix domain-containing protein [Alphaproteobacteria bacterium]
MPARRDTISAAEARRIALAAQGLADARPTYSGAAAAIGAGHIRRTLDRIGLLQIDSVNVLVRSHYLPLHARLGAYPMPLLDRLAWGRKRTLFEYWGHAASLMPLGLHPLLRWRMEQAARGQGGHGALARFAAEKPAYVARVLAEVADRGPLAVSDLSEGARNTGAWWGWGEGKYALEWLFWIGRVTTATRRNFERIYDLTERVLPADIVAAPAPAKEDAQRELLRRSVRALGVATAFDLADYFRLRNDESATLIAELVEEGTLLPVAVEGWDRPAFLHSEARRPRRATGAALLSPFDPVVWERARAERLFGFHYRIGLYTPADKRSHGYYVLPFLMGDRLAARIDL